MKTNDFNDVLEVVEFGANKYGEGTWLNEGVFRRGPRLQSAFRHLMKDAGLYNPSDPIIQQLEYRLGYVGYSDDVKDEESGLSHKLHCACNMLMAYTLSKQKIGEWK